MDLKKNIIIVSVIALLIAFLLVRWHGASWQLKRLADFDAQGVLEDVVVGELTSGNVDWWLRAMEECDGNLTKGVFVTRIRGRLLSSLSRVVPSEGEAVAIGRQIIRSASRTQNREDFMLCVTTFSFIFRSWEMNPLKRIDGEEVTDLINSMTEFLENKERLKAGFP